MPVWGNCLIKLFKEPIKAYNPILQPYVVPVLKVTSQVRSELVWWDIVDQFGSGQVQRLKANKKTVTTHLARQMGLDVTKRPQKRTP